MTQFFLGTNLEHLTGKSQTSNDLISCCNFEEKNKLYINTDLFGYLM